MFVLIVFVAHKAQQTVATQVKKGPIAAKAKSEKLVSFSQLITFDSRYIHVLYS